MMIDILLALVLPYALMLGLKRIVLSRYGALIVTIMIMLFGLQFWEKALYLNLLALVSLALGWRQVSKTFKK